MTISDVVGSEFVPQVCLLTQWSKFTDLLVLLRCKNRISGNYSRKFILNIGLYRVGWGGVQNDHKSRPRNPAPLLPPTIGEAASKRSKATTETQRGMGDQNKASDREKGSRIGSVQSCHRQQTEELRSGRVEGGRCCTKWYSQRTRGHNSAKNRSPRTF